MPKSPADAVAEFRRGLDAETLATVDALRALIAAADPQLAEEIKWNAPSFRLGTEHRVTLGLEREGGVRVVLHRGATKKDTTGFTFADPDGLATWPAKDRGVVMLHDVADVETKRERLHSLVSRWLAIFA